MIGILSVSMSKRKPSGYIGSHIATATSTIIGVLGVFVAIATWLPFDWHLFGVVSATLEVLLVIFATVVAGFAAKYVNSSIEKKETEEEKIDGKP